ncbi:hypothetical protein, partial [Massilia sp. TWP1-3-3]|uniref:hypothetical protein n=1 Tax=Massilia sp. TWP1-3-3 TaxID=2804573 RepID=UPI003CF2988C
GDPDGGHRGEILLSIGARRNLGTAWSERTWQAGIVKIHAGRRDFKVMSSVIVKKLIIIY